MYQFIEEHKIYRGSTGKLNRKRGQMPYSNFQIEKVKPRQQEGQMCIQRMLLQAFELNQEEELLKSIEQQD